MKNKYLIHSVFTNGLFSWAQIFLKSLNLSENRYRIIFDTFDLTDNQIINLKKLNKNLEIRNQKLDFNEISQLSGYEINKIRLVKEITEKKGPENLNNK